LLLLLLFVVNVTVSVCCYCLLLLWLFCYHFCLLLLLLFVVTATVLLLFLLVFTVTVLLLFLFAVTVTVCCCYCCCYYNSFTLDIPASKTIPPINGRFCFVLFSLVWKWNDVWLSPVKLEAEFFHLVLRILSYYTQTKGRLQIICRVLTAVRML